MKMNAKAIQQVRLDNLKMQEHRRLSRERNARIEEQQRQRQKQQQQEQRQKKQDIANAFDDEVAARLAEHNEKGDK